MLSKIKTNFIISLQRKKIRDKENLFVVEGDKLVREFLQSDAEIEILCGKYDFLQSLSPIAIGKAKSVFEVDDDELSKISSFTTPHNALAVVKMLKFNCYSDNFSTIFQSDLSAALDCVQDPGNMGTIIRSAAWFGIRRLYCSKDSVDIYNPKVIQAAMGAILHVEIIYTDLIELLKYSVNCGFPVYGTLLEGENIYNETLHNRGIVVLGNESKGISLKLRPYITNPISIPKFGTTDSWGINSLNVATASAVVFSEFARRNNSHLYNF